jgi:pimeloyl-ACP methyl ester carboxylesterase
MSVHASGDTTGGPDTIVLVHGLWVTPRSWELFRRRYEAKGFDVIAPAYPGMEVEVEALNADPSPIEVLDTETIAHHYETVIRALPRPPIVIGHSMGGGLTQILLDRGLGTAGVAISSVPVKGVKLLPPKTIRGVLPVLKNPANRHKAVGFTYEQWHEYFANGLSDEEAPAAYKRYHVPAPGRVVFEGATATFHPHAPNKVDFDKEDRAPLLFISGGIDNLMPPSVQKSNARLYNSGLVARKEYADRSHFICGERGWEEVADDALAWALNPTEDV